MSAFTEPLAQRWTVVKGKVYEPSTGRTVGVTEVLSTLAQVERLATDMETALGLCAELDGHMAYDEYPSVKEAVDAARAVLSAREEGTA